MEKIKLQITMLGGFSVHLGNKSISDADNRARKIWPLLAYLVLNRHRPVPQDELIDLLWPNSANPDSVVKTTLHRLRTMLNALGDQLGYKLIICEGGAYSWNRQFTAKLDIEEFDNLLAKAEKTDDPTQQLKFFRQALSLYKGDLLPKQHGEWLLPLAERYRNQYIALIKRTLPLLMEQHLWEEALQLATAAQRVMPYDDEICRYLLTNMENLGQNQAIIDFYEQYSEAHLTYCDALPGEEVRAIYRRATRQVNNCALPLSQLLEQLREPQELSSRNDGALFCDYDFFQDAYRAEARFAATSGTAVHIGLISVNDVATTDGRRKSAVTRLQELLCSNLRTCDIIARCSAGQFIVMLPQTSYEDATMLLNGIIKDFYRQYPGSTAKLLSSVEAIQPAV